MATHSSSSIAPALAMTDVSSCVLQSERELFDSLIKHLSGISSSSNCIDNNLYRLIYIVHYERFKPPAKNVART